LNTSTACGDLSTEAGDLFTHRLAQADLQMCHALPEIAFDARGLDP
jgi:hypothetical protein